MATLSTIDGHPIFRYADKIVCRLDLFPGGRSGTSMISKRQTLGTTLGDRKVSGISAQKQLQPMRYKDGRQRQHEEPAPRRPSPSSPIRTSQPQPSRPSAA